VRNNLPNYYYIREIILLYAMTASAKLRAPFLFLCDKPSSTVPRSAPWAMGLPPRRVAVTRQSPASRQEQSRKRGAGVSTAARPCQRQGLVRYTAPTTARAYDWPPFQGPGICVGVGTAALPVRQIQRQSFGGGSRMAGRYVKKLSSTVHSRFYRRSFYYAICDLTI
jgi:hypothetical protein